MVGVRQFDEESVIAEVMDVFWRQGYGATSMDNLAKATGVQRGSLYHAFGGKEELMLAALDSYAARFSARHRKALESEDLVEAIEDFLQAHMERMADPANPAGCLVTNSALECVGHNDAIDRKIVETLSAAETALYDRLRQAQGEGVIGPGQDLRAMARFLLGITRGMAVLHKAFGDLAMVRDVADTAMLAVKAALADRKALR